MWSFEYWKKMVRERSEIPEERNHFFKGALVVLGDTFHHGIFFISWWPHWEVDDLANLLPLTYGPQKPLLTFCLWLEVQIGKPHGHKKSPFLEVSLMTVSLLSHLEWILKVKFVWRVTLYWSRLLRPYLDLHVDIDSPSHHFQVVCCLMEL